MVVNLNKSLLLSKGLVGDEIDSIYVYSLRGKKRRKLVDGSDFECLDISSTGKFFLLNNNKRDGEGNTNLIIVDEDGKKVWEDNSNYIVNAKFTNLDSKIIIEGFSKPITFYDINSLRQFALGVKNLDLYKAAFLSDEDLFFFPIEGKKGEILKVNAELEQEEILEISVEDEIEKLVFCKQAFIGITKNNCVSKLDMGFNMIWSIEFPKEENIIYSNIFHSFESDNIVVSAPETNTNNSINVAE